MNNPKHTYLILIGIYMMLNPTYGYLNLYLNLHEVMRLLGVSAELYYVREGQVNDYALNFVVPVPADVNELSFTWQSLASRPLPYAIQIETSDHIVLPDPALNISRIGRVPLDIETWAIVMKCSGIRSAEVDVTISIEVVVNPAFNNITKLLFRRKKICLAFDRDDDNDIDDPVLLETVETTHSGLVTLIFVALITSVVIVLVCVANCARTTLKKQGQQNHTNRPISTSSFNQFQSHPPSSTMSDYEYISPSIFTTNLMIPRQHQTYSSYIV